MISWKKEWKKLLVMVAVFLACFYLPVGRPDGAGRLIDTASGAMHLVREYARQHVLLCLVPAFFIAGAIGVFISQASVMKYLGAKANKLLAYGVASVSGTILAVCSCTVLPLFAGIYRMGAGLGPATTFLYSGPAINVLAIVLTASVLGVELGIARAVGAIVFSIVIGLLMHVIFREDRTADASATATETPARPLWQNGLFFAAMVLVLVFANWGRPERADGAWHAIWSVKWLVTGGSALGLAAMLALWMKLPCWKLAITAAAVIVFALVLPNMPGIAFAAGMLGLSWITSSDKGEGGEWFQATWGFAKQILPLLLVGVLVAGALLGRPGQEALVPSAWVETAVGGNSLSANFFAAMAGALMYFATLTEVPILQGLLGAGMGKGPALAMLLAGPAVSLPNMLVIRSVLGTKKTLTFVLLVVAMATVAGMIYGTIFR